MSEQKPPRKPAPVTLIAVGKNGWPPVVEIRDDWYLFRRVVTPRPETGMKGHARFLKLDTEKRDVKEVNVWMDDRGWYSCDCEDFSYHGAEHGCHCKHSYCAMELDLFNTRGDK